jgi:four helix bundle protein
MMKDDAPRSGLPFARSFRELVVWQKARELQRKVFEATKKFPREEMFSLTDQIRRSSRSIGAQLAEAWAKRDYERHFVSKLTDADGEQQETQHWLITAVDDGYLPREEALPLFRLCEEIGRMVARMKTQSADFCSSPNSPVARETPTDYFATPPSD